MTQPLSLAYDKVQMKIKHLGCTAVSIVAVFVILSLSCTRDTESSSETAAETPSGQPSLPGEDSPDAADAAPEAFEPEVSATQEPTEQPESRPGDAAGVDRGAWGLDIGDAVLPQPSDDVVGEGCAHQDDSSRQSDICVLLSCLRPESFSDSDCSV